MELELGKPCPYCGEGSMVHDAGDAIGYYCSNGFKCKMFLKAPWNADPARSAMAEFTAPKHLRKGQALFVFMSWLATQEKVKKTHEHFHIADTFDVPDHQLAKWWIEWVMSLEEKK